MRDAESIQNPPVLGALVINSRDTVEPSTTIQLNTAIGHRVELGAQLFVSAGVDLDFASNGYSQASADVVADQTGELFYQPSGDVRLVSDSGHEYAVPEPGGPALLLAAVPILLWRRREGLALADDRGPWALDPLPLQRTAGHSPRTENARSAAGLAG